MSRFGAPGAGGQSSSSSGPRFGRNYSLGDKITGFGLSALESFPELFGIEPTQATQQYRAANPVGGFVSQAAGAFVPYLGAAKLARSAPITGGFIRGAEGLGRGSVSRFALGAAAEASVVEAGRIGAALTGVPEAIYEGVTGRDPETRSANDLLLEGAFNIGASGAVGGALGALSGRLSRQTDFAKLNPDMGPDRPMAQRIAGANDLIRKAQDPADAFNPPPEMLERLNLERENLVRLHLAGVETRTSANGVALPVPNTYRAELGRVFRPIVGERKGGQSSNWLNRLAAHRGGGDLTTVRRLIVDEKRGFRNLNEIAEVEAATGMSRQDIAMNAAEAFTVRINSGVGARPNMDLPDDFMPDRLLTSAPRQFKRASKPADQGRAELFQQRLTRGKATRKIGNGWFLQEEAGPDGMFVLSKKIKGTFETPAPGDEWAIIRTPNPGAFDPSSAALQKLQMEKSGWFPRQNPLEKINGAFLHNADIDIAQVVNPNIVEKSLKAVPGGRPGQAAAEVVDVIGDAVAPTIMGVTRNPRANALWNRVTGLQAVINERVNDWMFGGGFISTDKSMMRTLLSFKNVTAGGIDDMVKGLTPEGRRQFVDMLGAEVPAEQLSTLVQAGVLDEGVHDLLMVLDNLDGKFIEELGVMQNEFGTEAAQSYMAGFNKRRGHYGISQETDGPYRMLLNDEAGNYVGEVAGDSPITMMERADEVIGHWAARGRPLTKGAMIDEVLADPIALQQYAASRLKPSFFKSRSNLVGHSLEGEVPTARNLSDMIRKNLTNRQAYLRDVVQLENLSGELAQLERSDPSAAQFLRKRLGKQSPRLAGQYGHEDLFTKAQNRFMDNTLAAVGLSGKDSASKIVSETQKVLSDYQFAYVNLVNPIQNLLSTITVTLPELMVAANVSAASSKAYMALPAFDSSNNIRGAINVLSPMRLFNMAMKNAGKKFGDLDPELQELVHQMQQQGYLKARFSEENYGINSELLGDPMSVFEKGLTSKERAGRFLELFGSANRLLVTKTEEFNRLVAVNSAYEVGKLRGLNPKQMEVFTRDFLGKTAFNYSTIDRATIHTGPLGSLLGTFKNWMFHYMANMIRYATGGVETFPALVWQTASTALIGGAAATPLVVPIADAASKFLNNKPLVESLYAGLDPDDEWMGDGLLYGLPGMMGVSFASQAAAPFADPERDATMMFSLAGSDRMRSLGGGVKDAITAYAVTGESPFTDDGVRDQLFRALAPRTIYRAMSAGQDGAIRSMNTGYDVARLGLGSNALYALGFNPTELEKTYEVYGTIRGNQTKKKEMTQEFGKTLAQAWAEGDTVLANRVFARAMAVGVDTSSVLKSAKSRGERQQETQLEYTMTPEEQGRYSWMTE